MTRHDSEAKSLETSSRVRQWYRDHQRPSRQVLRRILRRRAWLHIKKVAGGEPRRNRRLMASRLARREYRQNEN